MHILQYFPNHYPWKGSFSILAVCAGTTTFLYFPWKYKFVTWACMKKPCYVLHFYILVCITTCSTNNILTLFEVVEHWFPTYYTWPNRFYLHDCQRSFVKHIDTYLITKEWQCFFFITTQLTITPFGTLTQILLWSLYLIIFYIILWTLVRISFLYTVRIDSKWTPHNTK